ncbi:MAG: DUF2298 domain-containing protein, partial [Clostridiales bacterium]|nr:DUF2298 domain-containing protein [Clostridiales bacterium]
MKGKYILPLAPLVIAIPFLRSDVIQFAKWWLTLLALGLIFAPLTNLIFKDFKARGYMFAKVIGIAISGYLTWVICSLKIMPFTPTTVLIVLSLCLAVNIAIGIKTGFYKDAIKSEDILKRISSQETLFIFLLFYWSYLRGIKPEIIGLEKFMDFGFVNSILRSEYFPPQDMWFAGQPINYYYLGQYFAAYLTRLSFVPSNISYNLMMATLFAVSFMLAYTIAQHLFEIYEQNANKGKIYKHARTISGLLAGALVTLSG